MSRKPAKNPMQIDLREIPDEGLTRSFDLSGDFARSLLDASEGELADVRPGTRLEAEVTLHRSGEEVIAIGSVSGDVAMHCSRCVAAINAPLSAPFSMTFVPRKRLPEPRPGAEMEVPPDQVDLAGYEDDHIDLEPTLREEVLLAVPFAPLCNEACKGLCPHCGNDLNQGACNCPPEPAGDDRWAALRNVKI